MALTSQSQRTALKGYVTKLCEYLGTTVGTKGQFKTSTGLLRENSGQTKSAVYAIEFP